MKRIIIFPHLLLHAAGVVRMEAGVSHAGKVVFHGIVEKLLARKHLVARPLKKEKKKKEKKEKKVRKSDFC